MDACTALCTTDTPEGLRPARTRHRPFADYDATRPQEVLTRAEALELAIKR